MKTQEETTVAIRAYIPKNEQEARDKALILLSLSDPTVFSRDNTIAHMTASAWIVNKERTKVLLCYHKIYDSWSWLGGHADGEADLLSVALREAKEESGLETVTPVSDNILSMEVLAVNGHTKKGRYVSSHLHLNVTYLLEADETEPLSVKPDENAAVAWFSPGDAVAASSEPWFREHIYTKLNARVFGKEV